jgi:hypothetical protein
MREVSESAVYEAPIAEFQLGKELDLRIEYYPSRETIQIFLDSELIGVSSLTYSQSFGEIACAKLSSHGGTGSLTVDNLYLESLNKLFVPRSLIVKNEEDSEERITFDASSSGNLPSRLTVSLTSGGAAVKVKEMIIDGVGSKALLLETGKGGIDTLKLNASDPSMGAEAMILEARIKCDFGGSVYAYFCDAKGKQIYRINFNVDSVSEGCGVRIDDNSGLGASYGYGTLGNPLSGKTRNDWFDLRIEFVNPDGGNIEARIFVDGVHFATSVEGAWAGKSALDITSVEFSTGVSAEGIFCIDEIALYGGIVTDVK